MWKNSETKQAAAPNLEKQDKSERTQKWIEQLSDPDDDSSVITDDLDSSTVYSSSITTSDLLTDLDFMNLGDSKTTEGHKIISTDTSVAGNLVNHTEILQQIFKGTRPDSRHFTAIESNLNCVFIFQGSDNVQTSFDKVHIQKSSRVHVGNITNITMNGPVQYIVQNNNSKWGDENAPTPSKPAMPVDGEESVECNDPNMFLRNVGK